MKVIDTIGALEELYDVPVHSSLAKVQKALTPNYKKWIALSRFLVLTTVGPEGTDASPRGDATPVVAIKDEKTLLLPDWRGNNRLDSLRNIVRDGRVSLMFMVPGCTNVVRVNGRAVLSNETALTNRFETAGKLPKTVIVISVSEVYFQCAKALMRSQLWSGANQIHGLPTAGDFISEFKELFDARAYYDSYGEYAKDRMW